jgi:hypothetical protein
MKWKKIEAPSPEGASGFCEHCKASVTMEDGDKYNDSRVGESDYVWFFYIKCPNPKCPEFVTCKLILSGYYEC